MEHQGLILNKPAKIFIATEYVLNGVVLEITPSGHHIIETSNGKVMEVENHRVLRVETKVTIKVDSDV